MRHDCMDAGGRATQEQLPMVSDGLGGITWLGKWQKTGILSSKHGSFGQDFGVIRVKNNGSDCSMGMSFRGKGVNSSYTLLCIIP